MDSPLVAAGVYQGAASSFYATGVNVMSLRPESGYDVFHAEEVALGKCAELVGEAVDVVVTLEPCQQSRQPKTKDTCSERIFKFS
jgi:pyrimidine deaminase RibD-like protein